MQKVNGHDYAIPHWLEKQETLSLPSTIHHSYHYKSSRQVRKMVIDDFRLKQLALETINFRFSENEWLGVYTN